LLAAASGIQAATHVLASALLWRARAQGAMGLRLVTNVLVILAIVHVGYAVVFAGPVSEEAVAPDYESVAPFTTLLLQTPPRPRHGAGGHGGRPARPRLRQHAAREAHRRLKMLADTDPMTGCFNRRRLPRPRRRRTRRRPRGGALLVLDMDGLKVLNDTQGHSAGDQAIRRTADAIRTGDAGRGPRPALGRRRVRRDPARGLARGRGRAGRTGSAPPSSALGLAASVGIATYGPDHDIVLALRSADHEMYEVKAARKAAQAAAAS
jgi:GGDEF domain-containing protein